MEVHHRVFEVVSFEILNGSSYGIFRHRRFEFGAEVEEFDGEELKQHLGFFEAEEADVCSTWKQRDLQWLPL